MQRFTGGIDTGATSTRAGGILPCWYAPPANSMLGLPRWQGKSSARRPLRTQDCPVFGRPSHPVKGRFNPTITLRLIGKSLENLAGPDGHGVICDPIQINVRFL